MVNALKTRLLPLSCLAALVTLLPAVANAGGAWTHVVEIASSGSVEAEFAYDHQGTNLFRNQHLTIHRAGAVVLDQPVRPVQYGAVWPANFWSHGKSVFVRDLDGDGEPEVFLDLYWGGAHCCEYAQVFTYNAATNAYALTTHIWGDPGVRLADLDHDGLPEFVSGDDRFAYQFTDFGDSSWPVQIWIYLGGGFYEVTQDFPLTIAADARSQWAYAFSRGSTGARKRGVLAAWAADECLLNRCVPAFRRLEALRKSGSFRVRYVCPCDSPRAYLAHLRRFLQRTGYWR